MQGSQNSGGVRVDSGGTLRGQGGGNWRIIMNGGTVAPGSMPGGVVRSGPFNEGGGSGTLQIELDSTTPGVMNTKLNAFGNVNLTGLNLSLVLAFVPPTNSQFVILENTSTGTTTGNFIGLPQNATFYGSNHLFQITYAGKTGNDVVLTDVGNVFQPTLTIERIHPESVRVSWPSNDPTFALQFNTNIGTSNWQPFPNAPVILGNNYVVTNSGLGTPKLFRLIK